LHVLAEPSAARTPTQQGARYRPTVPPSEEAVILRHEPCSWLPAGGIAEVVTSNLPTPPPPTPVIRLLITAGDDILAVPRRDGRGLDIPTVAVADDLASDLHALRASVLSSRPIPRLLGYVRNIVPERHHDYPWPAPLAHFAVWRCEVERDDARNGQWLDHDEAEIELGDRHWWPLTRHL
jgi:hypothetical protein